ncbi:hypothetical protein K9O30_06110 [Clostridium bowmanii]|uniref:hypothetical protein n=1 Tax=Clostridium bowmanii TaxID=132925 RepID=UPI001C0C4603|nr:hypothetical protein [Clostridium bowmanii]MBU3188734.1 hypothetical protein [Clostridium bowmanii]MCA1073319.1 hypothetical protein [Clostridium bowmanii]
MKSFNKSFNKYNYYKLTPIETYELVRSGKIKKFPKHFWECDDSDEYAPQLTRYLIEKILKWKDDDVREKLRKTTFKEHKLGGLLLCKYKDSCYEAITKAYPKKNFHAWDFVNAPNDYWQGEQGKENAIYATKWLIEEKLKWSENEIVENLNQNVFTENHLLGMLKKAFNCTLFEAIDAAYPGKFKNWEIGTHVKNNYWDKDKGVLAVKWLIEHRLKWTDTDIKENYSKQIYKDNNLYGMLQCCFNTSPFEAINTTYPNRFMEWELHNVPRKFWASHENCVKATTWLIVEKLKIDISTSKQKLSKKHFKANNLISLYEKYSVAELIELVEEKKTIK